MKDNKTKRSKVLKNNTNYGILVVGVLLVGLVLYLLSSSTSLKNNKSSGNVNGGGGGGGGYGVYNQMLGTLEAFSGLSPSKLHTPRQFELYKINNITNKLEFIFSPPKPNLIANQVTSYMLVVVGYTQKEIMEEPQVTEAPSSNEGGTEPTVASKNKVTYDIISKQMTIKTPKELQPNQIDLVQKGKYKFEIDMPPKTIPKVSRVVGNIVEDETIFYKFGLMANYPNIFSNIMSTHNISTFYPLNEGFDYQEIKELIKLGREFRSRLEDSQKTEAIVNDPNVDLDFKYQQISDMLGDYPNNLFIEDSTLDKEVQQSLSKGIIDVKVV